MMGAMGTVLAIRVPPGEQGMPLPSRVWSVQKGGLTRTGPIGRVTAVQHAELGHHVTALGTGIETPTKEVLVSCRHCTESWSFGGLCCGAGAGGCGKSDMWEQKWRKQRKLRSG